MEMNKENFEKLLNQIKASGKPATEWFGKYTHDILMHPDNWWEALAVCEYALDSKEDEKQIAEFFHLFMDGVLNRRLGDSAFRNTSDLLDFLLFLTGALQQEFSHGG